MSFIQSNCDIPTPSVFQLNTVHMQRLAGFQIITVQHTLKICKAMDPTTSPQILHEQPHRTLTTSITGGENAFQKESTCSLLILTALEGSALQ